MAIANYGEPNHVHLEYGARMKDGRWFPFVECWSDQQRIAQREYTEDGFSDFNRAYEYAKTMKSIWEKQSK